MLSINTNISSIVAQRSMTTSTTKLNQAIERLSTGSKINHAADNAANYSITRNMSTQLSACDVAADNIAMGMDLLSVAQDTIAGMQDRGSRIHALITQARNGTYGADSLAAMTQEANALVSEINRLYMNTEYNGIKLFEINLPEWAKTVQENAGTTDGVVQAQNGGFIAEVVEDTPDVTVTDPTQLADAISSNTKIGIGNAETLAKLAELVNDGTNCSGKTIILTEDIDLSAYHDGKGWTPIGTVNRFQGTFNGNGHKVTGLYINRPNANYQGLFGYAKGELKNVAVIDADVTGKDYTGGLVGYAYNAIRNSYATGNVIGGSSTGGLAGLAYSEITNSYATGNVTGNSSNTGGLAGWAVAAIRNSYATGNVTGGVRTGGLVGYAYNVITNSYATGNVIGGSSTGGLAGWATGEIRNSYATGNVSGTEWVGGLIGQLNKASETATYENILCSGTVSGDSKVGNLIGGIVNTSNGTSFSTITLKNTSAHQGDVMIGFEGKDDGTAYESGQMNGWLRNITAIKFDTTLQVGTYGNSDARITVDTRMDINLLASDLTSDSAFANITSFLNQLSQKATAIGAAQNRLESALESNLVKMDNLTSSLSTIRDADISEVSSDFIRQQILQQACATLMSTANQSPSIALQLL